MAAAFQGDDQVHVADGRGRSGRTQFAHEVPDGVLAVFADVGVSLIAVLNAARVLRS